MPPEITPQTVAGRAEDVLAEDVLGETVILNVASGRYTRLNRTGGALWARLARPATVGELGRELAGRFGVPGDRALADATALVASLAERGLVTLES